MFLNTLRVALRSVRREKLFATINVLGLSIGLTVCLLTLAYVKHEWSFDRFHEHKESLYRVDYVIPTKDGTIKRSAGTSFLVSQYLRAQIPEIEAVVAMADQGDVIVRSERAIFRERVLFADSQFFSVFTFPFLAGDRFSALNDPHSVVMTRRMATKYFGDEPAIGRTISLEIRGQSADYVVRGVAEDFPSNSTLQFDFVLPVRQLFTIFADWNPNRWGLTWPTTYVELKPGASKTEVNSKLAALGRSLPVDPEGRLKIYFELEPITNTYLNTSIDDGIGLNSRPFYSYVMVGIALLVLALACINFTTLAIGRSQTRTREVGVRKVLGAQSTQLIGRFLGEAAILCVLATATAIVLAELLLPSFNSLAGKQIPATIWFDWETAAISLVLIAGTTAIAGGYPAIIASRAKLVDAVKGNARLLTGGTATRVLVVLQFGLSIALIVSASIMSNQLRYVQSAPLGFDKEQLLFVKLNGTGPEKLRVIDLLRNSLKGKNEVVSLCGAGRSFDGRGMSNSDYLPDSTMFTVYADPVDEDFVATMGLHVIEGSNFTGSHLPDTLEPILVNEALVRSLGWKSALGQQVPGLNNCRVIGVVNDFNFRSLTYSIDPVVLPYARAGDWSSMVRVVYFRLRPGNLNRAVETIREVWERTVPNLPFDYQFMDEHIDAQYRFEQRWWKVVGLASIIAVLVACFGAFGLTALAVARRQKEIGVRKVLGASSTQIVALLNREFVFLVLIGNLLAWPAAYLVVQKWLDGFAFHITVTIWPFLLASLITLVVVVATVSAQAILAAWSNPVDALRFE